MDFTHIKEWPTSRLLAGGLVLVLVIVVAVMAITKSSGAGVATGTVVDGQGVPIDGATVVGANDATVTLPDGSFSLLAEPRETLFVSASGYSSLHVPVDYGVPVELTRQPSASVRVAVVGPDNAPLADALVTRLDANTSAPVGEGITDGNGEVLFENIPSGRAMFVVLSPGLGMGWVMTAVAPEDYARPVVRLEPFKGEVETASAAMHLPRFAQVAYALETPRTPNRILLDETKVKQVDDTQFQIIERTRTVVAASYDVESVTKYIDQQKKNGKSPGVGMDESGAVDDLLGPDRVKSPLITTRIIDRADSTRYTITQSFSGTYSGVSERTQSIVVEVRPSTTAEVMGYLQQQYAISHATASADANTVVATSWAQAEVALLAAKTVALEASHGSVCCLAPSDVVVAMAEKSGKLGENDDKPASMVSSNLMEPATLKTADNEGEQFFFRSVRRDYTPDKSSLENIRKENPSLTFTDQKTGREVTLMNIPAPYPDDAPKEFVLDYLDKGISAPDMFFDDRAAYNEKWKDYLYTTAYALVEKEGMSPTEFHDDLLSLMDRSMIERQTHTMNVMKAAELKRESDRLRESLLSQPKKVEPKVDPKVQSQMDALDDALQVDSSPAALPVAVPVPKPTPPPPSSGSKPSGCGGGSVCAR